MKRGELWVGASSDPYTRKPRPLVVVQSDHIDEALRSITVCPLTTRGVGEAFFRVVVKPNQDNGLEHQSEIEVEKITTMRKSDLDKRIGMLSETDIRALNHSLALCLELTGERRRNRLATVLRRLSRAARSRP